MTDPAPIPRTCESCRHARFGAKELATYGHRTVGTCVKGGPDPAGGCSDIAPSDSCARYDAAPERR